MRILELSKSTKALDRVAATAWSFSELAAWIGADEEPRRDGKRVIVKFTGFNLKSEDNEDMVGIQIHIPPGCSFETHDRQAYFTIMGSMSSDMENLIWHNGSVNASEWPFVVFELVRTYLEQSNTVAYTETPDIVQRNLKNFFPNTDFMELLALYNTDLLALDRNDEGQTTLKEFLYQQNFVAPSTETTIPSDFDI